jgi:hypothetical protein
MRQSGVPQLRVTDLVRDADLSGDAADDVRDLLRHPDTLDNHAVYQRIEAYITNIDVGAVA